MMATGYPALYHISALVTLVVELLLVIGNLFVICVLLLAKSKFDRNNLDLILLLLSSCDVLSVLLPEPLWVLAYFEGRWQGGRVACEFYQVTSAWFQLSAMTTVVFLCLNRVLTLRNSLRSGFRAPFEYWTPRPVLISLGVVYLIALIISALPLFKLAPPSPADGVPVEAPPPAPLGGVNEGGAAGPLGSQLPTQHCASRLASTPKTWRESIYSFAFIWSAGLCLVTVAAANISLLSLWRQVRCKLSTTGVAETQLALTLVNLTQFGQSLRVMVLISVTAFCTWIPTVISTLLQCFGYEVPRAVILYALLSTTLSGVVNPVIYCVCSANYRRLYRQLCRKCCAPCWPRSEEAEEEDEMPDLSADMTTMRREETTQFVLTPSSSDHSGLSRPDGAQTGSDIALRKFLMHNPTFDATAEDPELSID